MSKPQSEQLPMRDLFAMAYMAAHLFGPLGLNVARCSIGERGLESAEKAIARNAYAMADAMLKARKP
jgi:hypothetical protein